MGSVFCGNINLSVFGESHGKAIGCVLDGFPAGMKIDEDFLKVQLKRRAPKSEVYSTKRSEADEYEILSGVKNGFTEGSPICFIIKNTDARSESYDSGVFRPSHADYTADVRYNGFNDASGGGHFSGRLTAPIVIAGTLCRQFLNEKYGVKIYSRIKSIGKIADNDISQNDIKDLSGLDFPVCGEKAKKEMLAEIAAAAACGDSVGGSIECFASGVKAGLGSPMMRGVESRISSLLFAVPAVKGVEFGKGFKLCEMRGSEANDPIRAENGKFCTLSNNNGGIIGGITNGMPLVFTAAIKPTPSIALPQQTANKEGMNLQYQIKGRHDPCIVPRAVPVIESVAAVVLLDLYTEACGYEHD
jgi:chorismate synthase